MLLTIVVRSLRYGSRQFGRGLPGYPCFPRPWPRYEGDMYGILHRRGVVPARRAGTGADPGATFRRRHNRRKFDQPINQPKKTANAELSKTPAATPSHRAQIETLAMASRPCRTTLGHIAPRAVDEPLTDPSPSSSSTPQIVYRPGRWPLSHWRNFLSPRSRLPLLSPDWATPHLALPPVATQYPGNNLSGDEHKDGAQSDRCHDKQRLE
jgi:hypothetical protein